MSDPHKSDVPASGDEAIASETAGPGVADPGRRDAMKRLGLYAASVAPAMLVVVNGRAEAQTRTGWECSSPGNKYGLRRRGHSGC